MTKKTNTGKHFGTVNSLLRSRQVPKEELKPVEPITPEVMISKKRLPRLQKYVREISNPRSPYPLLMSQDNFCQLLSITKETCAEWRRNFQIPYIRLPHRIFFRVEDVQDFLDNNTVRVESGERRVESREDRG